MKRMFNLPVYSKLSSIALLLVLAMLSFSCHKNPPADTTPTLPPITMVGANTMGCYVDGVLWTPSDHISLYGPYLFASYNGSNVNGFYIEMFHDHVGAQYTGGDALTMLYQTFTATGSYDLTDKNKAQVVVAVDGEYAISDSFTVLQGTLTITNFQTHIISGLFTFTAKNNKTGVVHVVTDGRFDVKIN